MQSLDTAEGDAIGMMVYLNASRDRAARVVGVAIRSTRCAWSDVPRAAREREVRAAGGRQTR